MKSNMIRDNSRAANTDFVQNYTELKVYQMAFEAAMKIYELSKKWPSEEKYSFANQNDDKPGELVQTREAKEQGIVRW